MLDNILNRQRKGNKSTCKTTKELEGYNTIATSNMLGCLEEC